MISDKRSIQELAAVMQAKGITDVVISPGSRNAPMINTFASLQGFNCYSVVDERSAAFFALGIALNSGKAVAINCTSGSALLNYAPAVAEAYYQKVPLVVISADRPAEWIDQGDGQTIRQQNALANFVKQSAELPQHINNDDELVLCNRLINQTLNACFNSEPGPVHINVPFTEPLYGLTENQIPEARIITEISPTQVFSGNQKIDFSEMLSKSKKVMILAGQNSKNPDLDILMDHLSQLPQVAILSETTSNLKNHDGVPCIDKTLATISPEAEAEFSPDLLVTFGHAIVSKRIKAFLRRNKIERHLHISPAMPQPDTYQQLTHSVLTLPEIFFRQIVNLLKPSESDFGEKWKRNAKKAEMLHNEFLSSCPFSDLKVFETIFREAGSDYNIHLANSSPVRYAQLFRQHPDITHYSNRGVSGIDGCISTAVGAALSSHKKNLVITGDLSFFYDSNGLWNNYVSKKLRIIVINNGGGNIFRIIPGPSSTSHLDVFYETHHREKVADLAITFGLDYYHACNAGDLNKILPEFLNNETTKPALLEVFTNRKKSPEVLKEYFAYLAKQLDNMIKS
jgi:2-succinyl-5-enolpyruvyl-6-hydroxy-3-cyclohexene-1-carboxylate synthase